MPKELIISAGGENKRIKKFLLYHFNGIPKHLLPIYCHNHETTIIEKIVDDAKEHFDKIIISSNSKNTHIFRRTFKDFKKIVIEVDKFLTGPLGPICRKLLRSRKRSYGCAGDFFCEFSWKDFEKFHNSHDKPISILIASSFSMPDGAHFILDDRNIIVSWKRAKRTKDFDLINIGAYIIDPDPKVIKMVLDIAHHKEDVFFDLFVPKRLICGYNPGKMGFNINTFETYKKLLNWLKI